jgi:arylsulfatase
VKDGMLNYEYNLFEINRTRIKADEKLAVGKAKIEVETQLLAAHPGAPAQITMKVNGKEVATGKVPTTAPMAFTANDCLDFGSPVSLEYFDKAPFAFNGTLGKRTVKYVQ